MLHRLENYRLLCAINMNYLDMFWSHRPGMVKINLMMMKWTHEVKDEVLVLVEGMNTLG